MNDDDVVRLRHMLDYAREVLQFTQGKTRADIDTDLLLRRALCYTLGIIGEAGANISKQTRNAQPQIPWRAVVGMRNFLFHAYMKVDLDILWNTASRNIPVLIAQLELIVSNDEETTTS